jgi:hypothetical protein
VSPLACFITFKALCGTLEALNQSKPPTPTAFPLYVEATGTLQPTTHNLFHYITYIEPANKHLHYSFQSTIFEEAPLP